MKKVLLGTTAIVAAGFAVGGVAQAADQPISVAVGGYYNSAMAFISEDNDDGDVNDNAHSTAFAEDLEIAVSGSTTLSNGITAGFKANIEGTGAGDVGSPTLDERFVFFRGSFGQIRFGADEDARQQFKNWAPGASGIFGVDSPFFRFTDGLVPTSAGLLINNKTYDDFLGAEDSLKLAYYSPSFNGFSFALSYAPDDGGPQQYGGNTSEDVGDLSNQWSAGAAFDHDFGDAKIHVSGGYSGYTLERCGAAPNLQNCDDNPSSFNAGATISFGKIAIGGDYMGTNLVAKDASGAKRDRTDFNIGISYWEADWGIAAQYARTEQDGIAAASVQSSLSTYAVNGSYILGPGVTLSAQIDMVDVNDDAVGAVDRDGMTLMVGSALSF